MKYKLWRVSAAKERLSFDSALKGMKSVMQKFAFGKLTPGDGLLLLQPSLASFCSGKLQERRLLSAGRALPGAVRAVHELRKSWHCAVKPGYGQPARQLLATNLWILIDRLKEAATPSHGQRQTFLLSLSETQTKCSQKHLCIFSIYYVWNWLIDSSTLWLFDSFRQQTF